MTDRATLLKAETTKALSVTERINSTMAELRTREIPARSKTNMTAMIAAQLLESYYTCLETLFVRVSQYFENSLPPNRWHSELLEKMTLRVEGIREAVISEATRRLLDELRRFRHFKRYYFDLDYDCKRIDYLLDIYDRSIPAVKKDLAAFTGFLDQLSP